ncbi:CG34163 [Drosophila busckii]|uniref:CG34163 n=2 Tax=Drosophila busckii TaxID=30019 RepID=A0A0M4EB56_DROBS|nr:CG34163 [Drosophila busckii]
MEKTKKSKIAKKAKDSALTLKLAAMQRKQKEIARVLSLKHEILLKSEVSYLQYIEMRQELERLNTLSDTFTQKLKKLKQQAK